MNPTIDQGIIESAYTDDQAAAASEWGAEFRSDISSYADDEAIDACIIPGRRELPPVSGVVYTGFIDASGGRKDSFTLSIAHKNTEAETATIDVCREWRPPFQPQAVVEQVAEILKRYKISKARADRYAGEWINSAFIKEGIKIEPETRSKSELYIELLPLLHNGAIELPDNNRLINQLKGLERKTRAGGRDQLTIFLVMMT